MDAVSVALTLMVPLAIGLVVAGSFLIINTRQHRRLHAMRHHARDEQSNGGRIEDYHRPGHLFRGQGEAITVAELLQDAIERGEGIRLNWPTDDLYASPIRADEQGQFPTVILPMVKDEA
ncbi:MAG TPA: hypothetical protein VFV67_17320 [Actinophytocola sp.]|uniref:hypothetical protein n=1 Tax=Actinophytocola sp. TaxID=1872138 RepID=UPI002DB7BD96|nr:hypothetical protein [Actinophytocola sp.]HEU5472416.1 hypothetical protein [Actinophytocola sp.]